MVRFTEQVDTITASLNALVCASVLVLLTSLIVLHSLYRDTAVLTDRPDCWSTAVSQIFFSIGVTVRPETL
jgi:hypothetical protein